MKKIKVLLIVALLTNVMNLSEVCAKNQLENNDESQQNYEERNVRSGDALSLLKTSTVYVGNNVAGYVVNGNFAYHPNYTGEKLSNQTINVVIKFLDDNDDAKEIHLSGHASSIILKYTTTTGQICVRSNDGKNYICNYSL